MTRVRLLTTILAVLAVLTLAFPSSASPLTTGTGTGTIERLAVTTVLVADGNVIQERDLTGTISGALDGTYVEHVRGVVHSTGLVTFSGTMTFTGTVAGCGSGTLTLGVTGQGVTGTPVTESSVRPINSAANTIDVHGVGTVSQIGLTLTYQVQYTCK